MLAMSDFSGSGVLEALMDTLKKGIMATLSCNYFAKKLFYNSFHWEMFIYMYIFK